MRTLRLVALSDDGKSLILAADGRRRRGRALRAARSTTGCARPPAATPAGSPRSTSTRHRAAAAGDPGPHPRRRDARAGRRRLRHPGRADHAVRPSGPAGARPRRRAGAGRPRPAVARARRPSPCQQFMTERLRLIDSDRRGRHAGTPTAATTAPGRSPAPGGPATSRGRRAGASTSPRARSRRHDAATLDFAEGTRLVRVVPDVPAGLAATPRTVPAVTALRVGGRDAGAAPTYEPVHDDASDDAVTPPSRPSPTGTRRRRAGPRRARRRPARPATTGRSTALLDEVAEHDTVVLGRSGEDPDADDPRARIPAWEDIVFGVRRHR